MHDAEALTIAIGGSRRRRSRSTRGARRHLRALRSLLHEVEARRPRWCPAAGVVAFGRRRPLRRTGSTTCSERLDRGARAARRRRSWPSRRALRAASPHETGRRLEASRGRPWAATSPSRAAAPRRRDRRPLRRCGATSSAAAIAIVCRLDRSCGGDPPANSTSSTSTCPPGSRAPGSPDARTSRSRPCASIQASIVRGGCAHPARAAERYGATERFVDGLWRWRRVPRRRRGSASTPLLSSPAASSRRVGCGPARPPGGRRLGARGAARPLARRAPPPPLRSGVRPTRAGRRRHADEVLAGAAHLPATAADRRSRRPRTRRALGVAGVLGSHGNRVLVDGPVTVERGAPRPRGADRPVPADRGPSPPGSAMVPPPGSATSPNGCRQATRVADPHRAVRHGGRPPLDRLHRRNGRLRPRRRRANRST